MSEQDDDALFAELAQLRPDISAERFAEVRSLPPVLRVAVLQQWADQQWVPPSESAGQRFLAILAALGGVAGAVGQVEQAAAGAKAL
jgi:hypothetical protein